MSLEKPIAMVTGASAGLGVEYCRQLADSCEVIVAVGRRMERLQSLATELADQVEIHPVAVDLSKPEGVTRAVEVLHQQGPVDYLVKSIAIPGSCSFRGFIHELNELGIKNSAICL